MTVSTDGLAKWAALFAHKHAGMWVVLKASANGGEFPLEVVESRDEFRIARDAHRPEHVMVYVPRDVTRYGLSVEYERMVGAPLIDGADGLPDIGPPMEEVEAELVRDLDPDRWAAELQRTMRQAGYPEFALAGVAGWFANAFAFARAEAAGHQERERSREGTGRGRHDAMREGGRSGYTSDVDFGADSARLKEWVEAGRPMNTPLDRALARAEARINGGVSERFIGEDDARADRYPDPDLRPGETVKDRFERAFPLNEEGGPLPNNQLQPSHDLTDGEPLVLRSGKPAELPPALEPGKAVSENPAPSPSVQGGDGKSGGPVLVRADDPTLLRSGKPAEELEPLPDGNEVSENPGPVSDDQGVSGNPGDTDGDGDVDGDDDADGDGIPDGQAPKKRSRKPKNAPKTEG